MIPPAIELSGLRRAFGATEALRGIDLSVPRGMIHGVLGPDGAGKSTLLRTLAGILPPTAGLARVLGLDLPAGSSALCDRIAYMPQRFSLYEDLTVMENVRFYADLYGVPVGPDLDRKISVLLSACRMDPFAGRLAGRLSGGMKQKLSLVCALVHEPELLLLDEPTNGVDPVSRREFWKIIADRLDGGVTVLVSTSYLDEAEHCHRVALLSEGRIVACDSPANLRAKARKRVFRLDTEDKFRAVDLLAREHGADDAYVMGPSAHVALPRDEEPAAARARIESTLGRGGLSLRAFEECAASLEDIFLQEAGL